MERQGWGQSTGLSLVNLAITALCRRPDSTHTPVRQELTLTAAPSTMWTSARIVTRDTTVQVVLTPNVKKTRNIVFHFIYLY